MRLLVVAMFVFVSVAACGTEESAPDVTADETTTTTSTTTAPSTTTTTEPPEDERHENADLSRPSCTHFRNVAQDATDGLLTDAELRTKLQEVRERAQGVATPGVQSASTELLAAITSGIVEDFEAAALAMNEACAADGW